jgi:predicted branched-subunit amino acid permease
MESLRTRLGVAYVLTDQAYAISIARWDGTDDPKRRVPYYLGGALLLWGSWQLCTIIGALIGPSVPEDVPIEFAVPLVFLVLLIPALNGSPALVAGLVGGFGAVLAAEVGAGSLSLMVGAIAGIAAGTVVDASWARRLPPPPTLDVTLDPEPDAEPE